MSQRYADIIIDISHEAIDRTFQYIIPKDMEEDLDIGMQVMVPFGQGNRRRKGFVIGISDKPLYDVDKLKEISEICSKGLILEGKLIKLAAWMKKTYGSTMITALNTVMPVKESVRKTKQKVATTDIELTNPPIRVLNEYQQKLVDEFIDDTNKKLKKTYLFHGITGSGKTEVYISCIKHIVSAKKQAILLIPEIALTYQNVARFKQHFGDRVAIINSMQSKGEKYNEFNRAKKGEVDVVIGPRSAMFAPCKNLGLIIIDEEHDGAYKSDYTPKYHARDVVLARADIEECPVILGSATPTIESYMMAKLGKYKLWELPIRPGEMEVATCSVVDMRDELRKGNRSIVSRELYDIIKDRLKKHEQVILFINRRGYNTFVSCRSCGEVIKCPNCDVSLTLHDNGYMYCHYCGYTKKEVKECPSCKSNLIGGFGTGTQKVEAEIKKLFPEAKTIRMDKDTTKKKDDYGKLINSFMKHEADIIIGTQMIVKGHDFKDVTAVGIILADLSLFANDYKASERTFDLLTQAAGRAGRSDKKGHVVIQTYKPENYSIDLASKQDYEAFYENEIAYRKLLKYPPVYNMMAIISTGKDYDLLEKKQKKVYDVIKGMIGENDKVRLIGPSDAAHSKINNIYRRVIYMKSLDIEEIIRVREYVEGIVDEDVAHAVDINPINMY